MSYFTRVDCERLVQGCCPAPLSCGSCCVCEYDTGLSFNLNYNRPSFFGFEAMPIVVQLTREFHLGTFDPQAGEQPGVQYNVDAASLLNSWLAGNRNATLTLLEHGLAPPLHMPKAKSLRLWKCMAAKKHFARFLGEDIFVPKIVPLRHKEWRKLDVGFVCTEGVPSIIPPVEWVLIVRGKKRLFKPRVDSEIGVFRYETFLELVGQHLEAFKHEESELKIIKPESAEAVRKILRFCDLPSNRGDFNSVAPDSFVDSEVAEAAAG